MKYTFQIKYELDTRLAMAVAIYLDCEHYIFLHNALSNSIEITEKGSDYYKCHQTWNLFGMRVGQYYTCRYHAPATFINEDLRPYPVWIPSIHHFVHTKTTLRYYENPNSLTTLSELTVEMDMPLWLYPFRKWIQRVVEKVKILKDLEDVALFDRRAKLYGRDNNSAYFKKHQFLLHKDDYVKFFGENCSYLAENIQAVQKNERWANIRDLDFDYVRDFLAKDYVRFTNFQPA